MLRNCSLMQISSLITLNYYFVSVVVPSDRIHVVFHIRLQTRCLYASYGPVISGFGTGSHNLFDVCLMRYLYNFSYSFRLILLYLFVYSCRVQCDAWETYSEVFFSVTCFLRFVWLFFVFPVSWALFSIVASPLFLIRADRLSLSLSNQ